MNVKEQKIWVVSEVFYPDETSTAYIMTVIAENLSGYAQVHVLCGPEGYGDIVGQKSDMSKVIIHRIKGFNLNKNNIFFRFLRLVFISLGMFVFGLFKIEKNDRVLLVTNPAFSIPLFSFLKKIKNFSYFILVHDVFPENLIPARILKSKNDFLYKLLKNIFDFSYKQANKLFVLGRDMKELMAVKTNGKVNIEIIENWADLKSIKVMDFKTNQIIQEHQLQDKIVFLFAGNLGRLQGLSYFFDIISSVENEVLHFSFIGNGAMLSELKSKKDNKQLKNVSFLGSFPRNQQCNFLNASHFGIVTLEEEVFGLGVPSKSYNIMAAGKPLFFIGNQSSEIAKMIKEYGCGMSFSMEQKTEIVRFLNSLNQQNITDYMNMGLTGRQLAVEKYSQDAILLKFKRALIDGN